MKIRETLISGLMIIETESHSDPRGAFFRLYCQEELQKIMGVRQIVQINHSCTRTVGAVRGLHFQYPPHAEMKLIRCIKGKVWDVAVDLRTGSETFLKSHAEELSPSNARMMIIPEGFAHGFQVMEPDSELLYLHTEFYKPEAEGGVAHDEAQLAISWPLTITDMSDRDQKHPPLCLNFSGIKV